MTADINSSFSGAQEDSFPTLYTTPFYPILPPYFVGRTVKTASMLITDEAGRWGQFRCALRRRDREAFDNLVAVARRHFSAIGNSSIIDPFEAVVLSILLETEKRLEALEGERDSLGLPAGSRGGEAVDKGQGQGP